MMNLALFTNHESFELLIKAQKAANRYDTQLIKVVERRLGVWKYISNFTMEDDIAELNRRMNNAKYAILALNREVKVLNRYYDLKQVSEVRSMIYDFLDELNELCLEEGKAVNE